MDSNVRRLHDPGFLGHTLIGDVLERAGFTLMVCGAGVVIGLRPIPDHPHTHRAVFAQRLPDRYNWKVYVARRDAGPGDFPRYTVLHDGGHHELVRLAITTVEELEDFVAGAVSCPIDDVEAEALLRGPLSVLA